MNIDPFSIATFGVGDDPIKWALFGFDLFEIEVEPALTAGSGYQKTPEIDDRIRLTIRIRFMGEQFQKRYLLSPSLGKMAVRLLSHRRSSVCRTLKVEATKL